MVENEAQRAMILKRQTFFSQLNQNSNPCDTSMMPENIY
jgi:hypothetical protein